ncbi:DUF5719 family protein [Brevibacterium casei]|uniref:Secreted protein n=1 Tax=Brevibacterium casei CIP 102111 TaxID=1255625 RepID=A0A2H1JVF7_9MICO|nr:DUF5719 family protein [Brevibacterium casei]QPR40018.1 hypothetical protein I6G94_03835 [Brevibacterium casei]QPR44182.1 hypothetical protein I6G93_01555 [Brevibacterium casei]SMX91439.1 hypothetical protein BC102111_02625 [Brevibacterium casei CIP 102111]
MKLSRSIVTFAAIAVPGVIVATTSFLAPITSGTLDRSPEQVRMPTADTRVICPGPLLTDKAAEGTDAEFVDDSNVSTRVLAASAPISAADGSVSAARLRVADLGGGPDFDQPASAGFVSGDDPVAGTKIVTGFARPGAPALTTALETVEGTSGDLAGLATLTCAEPASNFRILAGSGQPGSNSQLLLSNPGSAPVQARVQMMTAAGARGEPTELSIRAGSQRAVRLAGLAAGAEELAVDVSVDGGVLAGSVQETKLDGLTPQGIDLAAAGAGADSEQVLTGMSGKSVRVRVANPSDDLAEVDLKAYGPDGEIDLPRSSLTVVAQGVAEADLGELDAASIVVSSDRTVQASGIVATNDDSGKGDFATLSATDDLAETQLMALPRTGSAELFLSPGQGQVQVAGMRDDGSLTDPRTVDLEESTTTRLNPAEISPDAVRALVIGAANASGTVTGGVHASLLVTSDTGVSAVMPAPAPAGVAYRDIRLR